MKYGDIDPNRRTDLIDAQLTEKGKNQCNENKKLICESLTNLKYVLVSPMRRCLDTAYLIFKDNPNLEKIKFKVVPILREHLHTASDIPCPVDELIKDLKQNWPSLDTTLLENEAN